MVLGVFDSGVGGLTVLQQIIRQMPGTAVLYFADTARLPYGGRTTGEICRYVREILHWFESEGVDRVLMACNTSSALALPVVRHEFDISIDGLIDAGAEAALAAGGERIGVIATAATVASRAYSRAIRERSRRAQVGEVACPAFVPLIEGGQWMSDQMRIVARQYLEPLLKQRIDALIYGCTHYPYLAPIFEEFIPASIQRIDPAVAAVARLKATGQPPQECTDQAHYRFCVSGDPEQFAHAASAWLGYRPAVCAVNLPTLPVGLRG